MAKVFISSTSVDLQDHRKAVDEVLRRMKEESVAMEFFGSRPEDARTACLTEIEQCQFFIGIYVHRYGFCPEGSDISITEMEFDRARQLGLKMLCYVVDENHPWPPKYVEQRAAHKLEALKKKVNAFVRSVFTTPDDLAKQVAADLSRDWRGCPAPSAAVWKKILAVEPSPPPEFMGDSRNACIDRIRDLIKQEPKTVVLCGQGGEGKTSILARFYEQCGAEYPHVV